MTRSNKSLITGLTFVATLGGLLFGYDTAVISGAVSSIDANFIDPLHLSETARSSLSGWTPSVSVFKNSRLSPFAMTTETPFPSAAIQKLHLPSLIPAIA